ncbi:MAG: hypothetical protein ACLQU2_03370 [Candidatus Binataceae bacterium]
MELNAVDMQWLVKYNGAKQALTEAHRIDEVKPVKDFAQAMRIYAFQKCDTELIKKATELKLRAARRLGEILIANPPVRNRPRKVSLNDDTYTLPEVGITRDESSDCQKLAKMPEGQFEDDVAETLANFNPFLVRRIRNTAAALPSKNTNGEINIESNAWNPRLKSSR